MIVHLTPEFHYVTVPKMSAHAFLKATVQNTTEYALLSGPVNVFLDNNFVATSTLKDVSPQESFQCSLGIDSSVRITYPPRVKHQAAVGMLSRVNTFNVRQEIKIKNGRATGIRIRVLDHVPVSETERIKVELRQPATIKKIDPKPGDDEQDELAMTGLKEPRLYVDKNTLEWVFNVDGGKEVTTAFAYQVTCPVGESVEGL
jgi:uncharacterized protein (TIGR02231 family)